MKVEIHKLFDYLLDTTTEKPDAVLGFSLSSSPTLGAFLSDLDPNLSLDWNCQSFQGLPALRGHVLRQANLEKTCSPDDVLITAGAAEANYLVMRQLLQPGDEFVLETPGWPQAGVMAKALEAQARLIRREEADGWAFPMGALRAAVNARTKLIFLTNPNNPTGRLFSTEELSEIADIARQHGTYVLVDEVYAGLEWDGERRPSIAGIYERGITTGSVSKALGLQGLRTGWLICRDRELVFDAIILRENSSEIMNIMGEVIAEIALRPDRYHAAMTKARSEGETNLEMLDRFIEEQPLLSWVRPQAGLIGLARLHLDMGGEAFARKLLAPPYKTFLIPGDAYDQPNHIRLGVGGGAAVNLEEGLSRLAALLEELQG
ncbi:aminotransferase class I/II-fold pyridoxal phosphate-dependent enzyme [Mesorhizobium sp. NBSH29]|uniref:aminotransferase class I/II-fold pyridoxal phosphate-dependent enzyme n=1 Tax=Mesorhizobium sp. NBSH29 TaxID=2654249 RepID=UPI0018965C5D|nr:aminotransferase class I/II-fold pyridoxal phosphate-dependent enzyme [Mesorhizobium sp. NBSH29]QPC85748.1 aminotransferase class I/II-fold pyridoxal phosphate-dependent enzyme [Mesorhizobium sp. NBSH29]